MHRYILSLAESLKSEDSQENPRNLFEWIVVKKKKPIHSQPAVFRVYIFSKKKTTANQARRINFA
jgi:hypothetical protein